MPSRKFPIRNLPESLKNPIELEEIPMPSIMLEGSIEAAEAKLHRQIFEQTKHILKEKIKKMEELRKLYGHPESAWQSLCWDIANDYIRGFQVVHKKKKGRKITWNPMVMYILWYEVHQRTQKGGYARNACRHLSKFAPWKDLICETKRRDGKKAETKLSALYARYDQAKNSPLVTFVLNIRNSIQEKMPDYDVLGEWHKIMKETAGLNKVIKK
jgi:hypothetical protein